MNWRAHSLACASLLTIACVQPAHAQVSGPAAEDATLGEIVVTARRRSESLQEVPQVVNAVTADTLQKLAIKDFRDIQTVVPGISFGGSSASMRGVSFEAVTSAEPTVAFYLNDTLVQASHLFQVMFDVGQVEVLRGPQGTNRGVSAPSGAITVTTRKPDLSDFGGYVDVSLNDLQRRNVNGAINIPLIRDVLGLRIAGLVDQNTGTGVRSLYSKLRPSVKSTAVRTSLSFEPSDRFNAFVTYVHVDTSSNTFDHAVTGPGFPGVTPPIGPKDRVSVQDVPTQVPGHLDAVTAQIDSRVLGQHLTYVGGYSHNHFTNREDRDTGQNLPGAPFYSTIDLWQEYVSQEIRIASDPAPDRFLDYVVGAFYRWNGVSRQSNSKSIAAFLPPAFGPLTAPSLAAFNGRAALPLTIPTPSTLQDTSIFGSVTLHFGPNTELTGGLRHLWTQATSDLQVVLGDPSVFVPVPCFLFGLPNGTTPGSCLPAVVARPPARRFHEEHTTYNLSLKHRFTRDLMVYGSVGSAYRPPFASIGLFNAGNDPVLTGFQIHPSEKSRSYEVGVKWSFLDGRGRLNAALFRQKFRNLPTFVPNIPYVANTGASIAVQNFSFTANPDALVEGFDVDTAFQITPQWSVSGQLSYSDGRVSGGGLPCNDSNFDGRPDSGAVTSVSQFPKGVLIAICPGGSISQLPYWNATVQSEYVRPVRDDVDAYVRGLLTYYPKNGRATPAMVVDNYSLLNLYAGVRAHDGAWEVGLFAKNALKTEKLTNLSVNQLNNVNSALSFYPSLIHSSGYFEKTLTPRREVGINVRYAFGSR